MKILYDSGISVYDETKKENKCLVQETKNMVINKSKIN